MHSPNRNRLRSSLFVRRSRREVRPLEIQTALRPTVIVDDLAKPSEQDEAIDRNKWRFKGPADVPIASLLSGKAIHWRHLLKCACRTITTEQLATYHLASGARTNAVTSSGYLARVRLLQFRPSCSLCSLTTSKQARRRSYARQISVVVDSLDKMRQRIATELDTSKSFFVFKPHCKC
jgi:hypothetical protein